MAISTPAPASIQIRRSRLVGLVAGVAAIAAGITWAVSAYAVGTDKGSAQSARPTVSPAFTEVAKSLSSTAAAQQTAAIRYVRDREQRFGVFAKGVSTQARAQLAASKLDGLGLTGQERQYVLGILSLTPAQQAAAFGGPGVALRSTGSSPAFKQLTQGISTMTRAQQTASVIDALGLDPQDAQYVMGITSLTPKQQAAAFGR
jgi:hypothetical protein